jgi:predicted DNA-binding transcriptional regulator AlpA
MRQVQVLTTLSPSTQKRLTEKGLFPEMHAITDGRRKAYYADEIDDWIANPPPFNDPASSKTRDPVSSTKKRLQPYKK